MRGKKQETVADIVAEMRDEGHTGDASCLEWIGAKMRHYADRIEAAYNRLPLLTPEQWTAIAQQGCEVFDLKRENARLRAALKPVLENERETNEMNNETNETQEPSLDAATVISIARHYWRAKTKHPYFADRLCLDEADAEEAMSSLERLRFMLQAERKQGEVCAETLANCELAEAWEAYARGDKAAAVEECYDVIAVMLRIIDVIEERQKLGRPKTANESEAKE